MRRTRNLEQTPGLIDADVAGDVRSMGTAVSGAVDTGRIEASRQVEDIGTLERDRVFQTNGARYAIAELGGVLDIVYAGDGGMAAEQERRVVARISMPRRRVGRSRFTEGEARELDEHELDRDITFADVAQQTADAIAAGVCSERAGVKVVAVKRGE